MPMIKTERGHIDHRKQSWGADKSTVDNAVAVFLCSFDSSDSIRFILSISSTSIHLQMDCTWHLHNPYLHISAISSGQGRMRRACHGVTAHVGGQHESHILSTAGSDQIHKRLWTDPDPGARSSSSRSVWWMDGWIRKSVYNTIYIHIHIYIYTYKCTRTYVCTYICTSDASTNVCARLLMICPFTAYMDIRHA